MMIAVLAMIVGSALNAAAKPIAVIDLHESGGSEHLHMHADGTVHSHGPVKDPFERDLRDIDDPGRRLASESGDDFDRHEHKPAKTVFAVSLPGSEQDISRLAPRSTSSTMRHSDRPDDADRPQLLRPPKSLGL